MPMAAHSYSFPQSSAKITLLSVSIDSLSVGILIYFFNDLLLIICMSMYLHVYMLADMSAATLRDPKRVLDSRIQGDSQVVDVGAGN